MALKEYLVRLRLTRSLEVSEESQENQASSASSIETISSYAERAVNGANRVTSFVGKTWAFLAAVASVIVTIAAITHEIATGSTVQLGPFSLPKPLTESGYNSKVIERELASKLVGFQDEVWSIKSYRDGDSAAATTVLLYKYIDHRPRLDVSIPNTGFSVQDAIDFTRRTLGISRRMIAGAIFCERTECATGTWEIVLHSDGNAYAGAPNIMEQGNTPAELIQAAAVAVVTRNFPYRVALYFHNSGDDKRARKIAESIIQERGPDRKWAMNLIGYMEALDGHDKEARAWFDDALTRDPSFALARANLGSTWLSLENPKKALTECEKASTDDPNYAPAHNCIGLALLELSPDKAEALASFRRAATLDPSEPQYRVNIGMTLFKRGETKKAIAELTLAANVNGRDPNAFNKLGGALYTVGELDAALANHRKAVDAFQKLKKSNTLGRHKSLGPRVYYDLAESLLSAGKRQEAIDALKESRRLVTEESSRAKIQKLITEIEAGENPDF